MTTEAAMVARQPRRRSRRGGQVHEVAQLEIEMQRVGDSDAAGVRLEMSSRRPTGKGQ
jgi:hypothetical protein